MDMFHEFVGENDRQTKLIENGVNNFSAFECVQNISHLLGNGLVSYEIKLPKSFVGRHRTLASSGSLNNP